MIRRIKKIKYWKILIVTFLLIMGSGLFLALHSKPAAASVDFNNLMDDYVFENTNSMSAGQINSFLNSFPNSCISPNPNGNGNWGFTTPDPLSTSSYGGNVTAGQAIYDTGQLYHVNPQVILAMLQKEQSIVTGSAGCHYSSPDPNSATPMTNACGSGTRNCTVACVYAGGCMNIAMSYACPNYCNANDEGFSKQLALGAWLLRFSEERTEGKTSGYAGYETGDSSFSYSGLHVGVPGQISDGSTITARSGATAALYYYNPFEHPNENFVNIFQSWFGPTTGQGYQLVIASNCSNACPQYVVYGTVKQYVTGVVKAAWGLPDTPDTIDPNALNTYSNGPDLGLLATLNVDSAKVLYFMDNGHRYRVPWPSMLDTWNLRSQVISNVSPGLFAVPSDNGDLYNAIKDPNSSTYYMMDGANGSGQTVIRPYASDTIRLAWEGDPGYVPVSSNFFSSAVIGSTLNSTSASCNGSNFQVSGGGKYFQSAAIGALFPSVQSVSLATFSRLPNRGNLTAVIQAQGDPAVYLVDNGTKRHITGSGLLNAWSASGQGITPVNSSFVSALPSGSDISSFLAEDGGNNYYVIDRGNKYPVPSNLVTAYSHAMSTITITNNLSSIFSTGNTATGFVQAIGQPAVYVLDDSGNLRHLPNPTVAGLWGAYQAGITSFSNYIVSGITTAADVQAYVSNGTTNYMLDVGKLASVSGSVATDWGLGSPLTFSDTTLNRFSATSALANQLYDGQTYFYIRGGAAYSTTDNDIAGMWGLIGSAVHNGSLVFSSMSVNSLSPVVKSSTNGSNYYIVDNGGTWYHLPSTQYYNDIVGANAPTVTLNPSYAPNTIGDWASVVVTNSGNYYAIDGGVKRLLPAGAIRDQWTNSETHTDQAVDSYFLNRLSSGNNLERAVIGSGPAVYSVENEVKRHITSSVTLNQSYAPVTKVSDSLLDALTTGSDIN